MKIPELARRIAGLSVSSGRPKPPANERDLVRAFLTFLEDRRVLYNPYQTEIEHFARQSIQEVRERCTQAIGSLPEKAHAVGPLKGIRAACRRFLDEPRKGVSRFHQREFGPEGPEFFTALGEFRATVGAHIATLAVAYAVELEAELASIVPGEDVG